MKEVNQIITPPRLVE